MKLCKDVHTGEVKFGGCNTYLRSVGIGSCVVVVVDSVSPVCGALAHVMLSGSPSSVDRSARPTRYARPALDRLFELIFEAGAEPDDLSVALVGGANVLREEGEEIGRQNVASIKNILAEKNLSVDAESLGGNQRRRVLYKVESGKIQCSVGSEAAELLWTR